MSVKYGWIHCHTEYSILDSTLTMKELLDIAKENGCPAIALTEHGNCTNTYAFKQLCDKYGIKAIAGVEAYFKDDTLEYIVLKGKMHVVFLAVDDIGYQCIQKIVSDSYLSMDYSTPTVNFDLLKKYIIKGHVLCLTACVGGILAKPLLYNIYQKKEYDKLSAKIKELEIKLTRRKELEDKGQKDLIKKEKLTTIKSTYAKTKNKLDSIKIMPEEEIEEKVIEFLNNFIEIFGKENFYIELQYHGMEEEKYVMQKLNQIAINNNIKIVATNDIHVGKNEEKNFKARQVIRALNKMNDFNYIEATQEEKELYAKTDEELSEFLLQIFDKDTVNKAFDGIKEIVEKCNTKFETSGHYPKYILTEKDMIKYKDSLNKKNLSEIILYDKCIENKSKIKEWNNIYEKQFKHEYETMCSMGFADYHLIVAEYSEYAKLLGLLPEDKIDEVPLGLEELKQYIKDNNYEVGCGIGTGRGSAVGSLICDMLDITNIDPIKYDLYFERFLNPERVTMPDIDVDFKPSIRNKVIQHLQYIYGNEAICRINTFNRLVGRSAIRYVGKVLSAKDFNGDKKRYYSIVDEIAKKMPKVYNSIEDSGIKEEFLSKPKHLEIIETAQLIENRINSYGCHAGAVVISNGNPIKYYMPLMLDKKGFFKSQYYKEEVEENGLIKMDILGLKNLQIISDCLHLIKQQKNIVIDINNLLDDNDKKVFKIIFSQGNTDFVFQFESAGMKSMLKRFKPDNFNDIICLVALYRPATMQYLDDIINIKNGKAKISYLLPELESILKNTYGKIIYQEQVMAIFQKLAEYSLGQADLVRRAMSKKKEELILKERNAFLYGDKDRNIKGCQANGINLELANQLFDEIIEFSKYAFNKSHATAYAYISYITAYFKLYFSLEYMTSIFNNSTLNKIQLAVKNANDFGIKILPPDINKSKENFIIEDGNIRYGLNKIKGVSNSSTKIINIRNENGFYLDYKDFLFKCNVNKGVVDSLITVNAINSKNQRNTLLNENNFNSLMEIRKNIFKIQKEIIKKDTIGKRTKLKNLTAQYNDFYFIDEKKDNDLEYLLKEKQLLGAYISGHPLDNFDFSNKNITQISELEAESYYNVIGIIEEIKEIKIKKGDKMAFISISDKTGNISCTIFPKLYVTLTDLSVGEIIEIKGKTQKSYSDNDELENKEENEEEIILDIIAEKILKIEKEKEPIFLEFDAYELGKKYKTVKDFFISEILPKQNIQFGTPTFINIYKDNILFFSKIVYMI